MNLEKIFSTTHLLIAYMDTDFNFVRVNRAYAETDGREPEFFVGKNHFDLYPHEENEAIFRRVVETDEPYTAYAKPFKYAEHPERGVTYWDWDLHPIKDASGQIEGLALCLVNVTERVKVEGELRKHRDHLEELIAERTAELAAANEQLQQEIAEREWAEKALRESEERFRRLADNAPDIVFRWSVEKGLEYVSPIVFEITGYTPEELIADPMLGFEIAALKDPQFVAGYERAMAEGIAAPSRELIYVRKDGSKAYLDVRSVAVRDDGGNITALEGILRDITERVRAEEALRQRNRELALLNQAGQELTATLDLHRVAERLLKEVTEIIGAEGASVWLWDEEQEGWLVCQAAFRHDQKQSLVNLRLRPGQGVAGWVTQTEESAVIPYVPDDPHFFPGIDEQIGFRTISLLAVPLRAGTQVIGALEVVNKLNGDFDTDDLALVETLATSAAIAIQNARLVEALRRQTVELQVRNEELDAFARTVAHDLKNPLGHIVGFARLLEKNHTTMPEEEMLPYLHTIVQSGRKMDNIIDELLLLAGVRKAEVEIQPLDMANIVAEAQKRLTYLIEEHKAEIILPDDWPVALGYGPWVEEVWVNYISNAIQYGGQPPRVELGADPPSIPPDGGMIRFWVRDNGPGLTPEEQARSFTPFTRLDQVRAKGHGLGLSIARRIVEKLGGQVGSESEIGRGSVFTFTLPGQRV